MRIFLSFCNTYLFESILLQHLAQCIFQIIIFEDHVYIFIAVIILRHRCIMQRQFMHVKLRQIYLA